MGTPTSCPSCGITYDKCAFKIKYNVTFFAPPAICEILYPDICNGSGDIPANICAEMTGSALRSGTGSPKTFTRKCYNT